MGHTRDTGFLRNFITRDGSGNVTISGNVSFSGTVSGYATESYVGTQLAALVASAPTTLNTLNELATALGNDPNFATTVTTSIGNKLPLAGGTLTGALTGTSATFTSSVTAGADITMSGGNRSLISSGGFLQLTSTSGAIYLSPNSSTLMTLTTGGLVGIGTTSPTRSFQISRTSTAFINAEGSIVAIGSSDVELRLFGSNVETMTLKSGNVGIGTTSPAWMLEVNKDTSSGSFGQYPAVSVNNPNASGYSAYYFFSGATNKAGIEYSNSANAMLIYSNGAERMRITSSGFVGLGTPFPTGMLHVYNVNPAFRIQNSAGGNMQFGQWDTVNNRIEGSGGLPMLITSYGQAIKLGIDGSENVRVATNGSFCIGGTDAGEKLNIVSGNQKFYTRQNVADQYVFIGTEYSQGNGNNKAEIRFAIDGSDTKTRIAFHTANGGGQSNEVMRLTATGTMINSGNRIQQSSFYGSSQRFVFQSAFDNPTATIFSWTDGGAYAQTMIRVTVIQNTVTGSTGNTSIWSVGYAMIANNPSGVVAQATVSSMVVQGNFGAANVGTLSWDASNNLRYTSNRVSNYDGYVVLVEYGSNTNQGSKPVLYVN